MLKKKNAGKKKLYLKVCEINQVETGERERPERTEMCELFSMKNYHVP
jgi:hypothetical protein